MIINDEFQESKMFEFMVPQTVLSQSAGQSSCDAETGTTRCSS